MGSWGVWGVMNHAGMGREHTRGVEIRDKDT